MLDQFTPPGFNGDDKEEPEERKLTEEERAELVRYFMELSEILVNLPADGQPETW